MASEGMTVARSGVKIRRRLAHDVAVGRARGLLAAELRPQDHVAIAVCAGAAGVALQPAPRSERARIEEAIERLEADGATAGGAGIRTADALAREQFAESSNNRIVLATDGDYGIGEARRLVVEHLGATRVTVDELPAATGSRGRRDGKPHTRARAAGEAEPAGGFRLAAAGAEFGLLLHESDHEGDASYGTARARAEDAAAGDVDDRRNKLVTVIAETEAIQSLR